MRSLINNKKAQDLSVTAIIIIILAIIVLVFLIFGIMRGGGNLLDNIKNFFGGGSNIDNVKSACQTACVTKSDYEYNTVLREVKWDSQNKTITTCQKLESVTSVGACENSDGKVIAGVNESDCISTNLKWTPDEKDNTKGFCLLGTKQTSSVIIPQASCTVSWVASLSKDPLLPVCSSF